MKIFVDESGDFSVKAAGNKSIVCGVIIPERLYSDVEYFVEALEERVRSSQQLEGEVKGSVLSFENRRHLCEFVRRNYRELAIVTTIVDSDVVDESLLRQFRDRQSETFQENKELYLQRGGTLNDWLEHFDRLSKLAKLATRLSDEELLQATAFIYSIPDLLQLSIGRYTDDKYRECFERYDWVVDRKLQAKLSPMEKFLSLNLLPFLDGASKKGAFSLATPIEWHHNHPFTRYLLDEGILLNVVFEHGLQFQNSEDECALRLVDMISNTIYGYLRTPSDPFHKACYALLRPAMDSISRRPLNRLALRITPKGSGLSLPPRLKR